MEQLLNKIQLGDCLQLMPKLPDKCIDLILCDLPYGITEHEWDQIIPIDTLWHEYLRLIKDNGAIVLTCAQPFTSKLVMGNLKYFRYAMIWDKKQVTGFLNAKKAPLRRHEEIVVFYKNFPTYHPQLIPLDKPKAKGKNRLYNTNDTYYTHRYPSTIIDLIRNPKNDYHPTQKPIALFEYLIKTYSNEYDVVLDNCMGSGTTAIACINTCRHFIGMEKDINYYHIACTRIEQALTAQTKAIDSTTV